MDSIFVKFKEQAMAMGNVHNSPFADTHRNTINSIIERAVPIYVGDINFDHYDEVNKSLDFMRANKNDFGIRWPFDDVVLFWKDYNNQGIAIVISSNTTVDNKKEHCLFPYYYDNHKYKGEQFRGLPSVWIPYPAGILCGETEMGRKYFHLLSNEEREESNWTEDDMNYYLQLWLAVSIHIACLLTCKNIRLDDRSETQVKRVKKLNSRKMKSVKIPVPYKTLVIDLTKKQQSDYGLPATVDFGTKGMDICRGHYKNYKKGKGLFGRYKGIYWWPARTLVKDKKQYKLKTKSSKKG